MVKLILNDVISAFTAISGCSAAEVTQNMAIIQSAAHLVSGLLDEKKCTAADVDRAEYAAAAAAFYDFVCKENARNKIVCTLTGTAEAGIDYKSRIASAKSLKESALEAIKPVTVSCDFLFRTMEG